MPFGDAMAIGFTSPLPAMILAFLVLGQRLRLYKLSAAFCITAGIALIAQPSFLFQIYETNTSEKDIPQIDNDTSAHIGRYVVKERYYLLGALSASLSSTFYACQAVILAYLNSNKSTNSVILVTFYQGIIGIPLALVCSIFTGEQM